jgi:hypothetical protein
MPVGPLHPCFRLKVRCNLSSRRSPGKGHGDTRHSVAIGSTIRRALGGALRVVERCENGRRGRAQNATIARGMPPAIERVHDGQHCHGR